MTPEQLVILGLFLPPIAGFIKQDQLPNFVNGLIAVAVYAVASVAVLIASGQPIDPTTVAGTFGPIAASGTVGYVAIFKNVNLTGARAAAVNLLTPNVTTFPPPAGSQVALPPSDPSLMG